jgi:hypothetical protein
MNYERLEQTQIPDLAPVYGGARGRTMSSRHQLYAWRALQEAGITTIIDLRLTDHTDRLPALCEEYGMRYFHYPVDTSTGAIAHMAALFPQLCDLIDDGNFYIACAMGLHRTDIALCAYWLFYGAEKGLEPPQIHGYRQEDGHTTDKLNRVLNALYTAFLDRNGVEPIPPQVFKERKAIIARQANGL